ncbi:MAG: 30S ribosomal protein S8 [Rickettsia endosymbiont of Bryobia graminum]|nr:30S ribosomal protein S8 [Rickettsia endosymbiont of Bryobia graminum]
MSMTDSIADMLTRIRNGQKSKMMRVLVPGSKKKIAVLDVLKSEGYIAGYEVSNKGNISEIEVSLKYSITGKPAICEISRVSKPGKRVYSAIDKLKGYYNNMGIYILSTPKGVLSDRQAHIDKVGGEVICKVF